MKILFLYPFKFFFGIPRSVLLVFLLSLTSCFDSGSGSGGGPSFNSEGSISDPVIINYDTLIQGYSGTVGGKGAVSYYKIVGIAHNETEDFFYNSYDYTFAVNDISKAGVAVKLSLEDGTGICYSALKMQSMSCGVRLYEPGALLVEIVNESKSNGAKFMMGIRETSLSENVELTKEQAIAGYNGVVGDDDLSGSTYSISGLAFNENYEVSVSNVTSLGNVEINDVSLCIGGVIIGNESGAGASDGCSGTMSLQRVINITWACKYWDYEDGECLQYYDTLQIGVSSSEETIAQLGYRGQSFLLKISEL